jgi:type VI secretion system protein ImpK
MTQNGHEEILNLAYPIFSQGLAVKERLDRGAALALPAEQAVLRGLLRTEQDAQRWLDFGGEGGPTGPDLGLGSEAVGPGARYLGVRYALACWLDELFVLDSPWGVQWNEQKLEVALYGTNDRAWRFWEQARRAEKRPDTAALEVFFLCVMLGFRGEFREEPSQLRTWIAATRQRIFQGREVEWVSPPELEPPTHVPPLRGRERLRKVIATAGVLLLLLLPVAAFFVVQQLGR